MMWMSKGRCGHFFLRGLVGSLLLFSLSCASQKKKASPQGEGNVASDQESIGVSEKELNFDPVGSDVGDLPVQTVHFSYDSAHLTAEVREVLARNAHWIQDRSNLLLQLEGHADQRGSVEYNLALGERRAQSVKSYLISLGIEAYRLKTISYGEEKLLSFGNSEEDHQKNRRVNFVIIPP